MRFRSSLLAFLFAVLLFAPRPALASPSLRLGFGADYWFDRAGEFNFTLGVLGRLSREISAGVRVGGLIITQPATAGIPLDLQLRASFSRLYFEGNVGPWILFTNSPIRAHAAFGFGFQAHALSFGVELGWLDPAALLGVRLGLKI